MARSAERHYAPDRVQPIGDHAVVLGASVAGLLAARVLADAFERVSVLDRDPLDTGKHPRRGVPQGQDIHVLLVAGQAAMEQLVPGFSDYLEAAGANVLDASCEVTAVTAGDRFADGAGGPQVYYASRPLIEHVLRARVQAHDRITLHHGCQVTGHLADHDGQAVTGVVARSEGGRHTIRADLVVDATGRATRSAAWLEQLGHPSPESDQVAVDLAYRSCLLKRPADDRRALLVMPSAPDKRGGARGAGAAPRAGRAGRHRPRAPLLRPCGQDHRRGLESRGRRGLPVPRDHRTEAGGHRPRQPLPHPAPPPGAHRRDACRRLHTRRAHGAAGHLAVPAAGRLAGPAPHA